MPRRNTTRSTNDGTGSAGSGIPTHEDIRGRTPLELEAMRRSVDAHLFALHQEPNGERRDLTPAEQDEFDQLITVRDAIDGRLEKHSKVSDAYARNPKAARTAFGTTFHQRSNPFEHEDWSRVSGEDARDAALRGLEQRAGGLAPEQQDRVDMLLRSKIDEDNPHMDGTYLAKRMLITETDAYRSAWSRVMTSPHPVLTNEEAEALRAFETMDRTEFRAMSEGTQAAGGYGVPVFIDPSIIMTAQGSASPMMRLGKVVPVTTNVWKGVNSAGVSWSFDAEASAVSDDSPTLAQPSISVYTARGFIPYSIEVGQDYPGFAEEMAGLLSEGYDELLADKLVRGSGSGEPKGIVTALDADTTVEVLLATAGTLAAGDLNKAWEQLGDRFKARASWLMSYAVSDKIAALGNSNNLSYLTVDFTQALQTLRTRPVEYAGYMTDLTSSGVHTNITVVGDFKNYVIPQRVGMNVELVPHLFDVTSNRPTGSRGWFAYARIGGDVSTSQGFRLLNQT